ncbi:MAG TPA: ATP-dependent Clp protease proteolytic subunit, partial [Anaerolineales bacterium]|nr:ATP-dependent Clp protease proteolytic subunit [Anaerolineales bacterium]
EKINQILSKHTGQPMEAIERDVERDFYMDAQMALEYGLIDTVLATAHELSSEDGKSKQKTKE